MGKKWTRPWRISGYEVRSHAGTLYELVDNSGRRIGMVHWECVDIILRSVNRTCKGSKKDGSSR